MTDDENPSVMLSRCGRSYHYMMDSGEPMCGHDMDKDRVVPRDDAEQFYDACKQCEDIYASGGVPSSQIRNEIREELGMETRQNEIFDNEELWTIHGEIVGGHDTDE